MRMPQHADQPVLGAEEVVSQPPREPRTMINGITGIEREAV
jgi:hypothetical protein